MKYISSQFSQLRFLHTCSGPRFLASMILNIVLHLFGSVLADASKFVIDFLKILTEDGQLGEIFEFQFMTYFLMLAFSTLAA